MERLFSFWEDQRVECGCGAYNQRVCAKLMLDLPLPDQSGEEVTVGDLYLWHCLGTMGVERISRASLAHTAKDQLPSECSVAWREIRMSWSCALCVQGLGKLVFAGIPCGQSFVWMCSAWARWICGR